MKAIVQYQYGSPDVLQLQDIDKPAVARLITGLRRPRNRGLGLDVAGQVEAIGESVTQFQPVPCWQRRRQVRHRAS